MSTTPLVTITIDGQTLSVPQGSMIIEAADNANIKIPRFCYHKKLSVAANCRMCLVEVSTSRKPLPSCATPVTDGMVVLTQSQKAISYQKAVMEFLLINHPLDCPVCDQGGECELQDVSMGYGADHSSYKQGKRSIEDKDVGPLVQTDLTRCILCTRCVRFGTEIAGMREMGMIGRGEHAEIATFMEKAVDSELSGNVIDLCPVGALTNKPFRYQARAWELQQYPMISMHDCLGSNLSVHVRRGEVMRAVPRENEALNEVWLSDRDRYSVHALNVPTRAHKPLIKKNGEWHEIEWLEALEHIAHQLNHIKNDHGAGQVGALAAPSSSIEELYLLQKLIRSVGSHNLDFRFHMQDFSPQNDSLNLPVTTLKLGDMNDLDLILVVGSDTRSDVPLFHHRIRQAALNGAAVVVINSILRESNLPNARQHVLNDSEIPDALATILKEVTKINPLPSPFQGEVSALSTPPQPSGLWDDVIHAFSESKKILIVTGQAMAAHPHLTEVMGLLSALKEVAQADMIHLTPGANSAGAYLAGFVPHQGAAGKQLGAEGLTAEAILDPASALKAYFLLNVEPGLDSIYGAKADQALAAAELVVALSPFVTDYLKAHATIILPIGAPTETAGSYVNVLGDWQSWKGVAKLKGEARPAWKVLRVLANLLTLPGFDYESQEEVLKELQAHLVHMKPPIQSFHIPRALTRGVVGLVRLGPLPHYASDMMVRESPPLQNTTLMQNLSYVGLRADHVKALGVLEGDHVTVTQGGIAKTLPIKVMDLAQGCVYLPRGTRWSMDLAEAFGPIEVSVPCS